MIVLYKVARKECLFSSVHYEESSRWDIIHPVRCRVKGELLLIHPVRGIKQAGIRPSRQSHKMESLFSFVRYEESSRWDYICLLQSRSNGGLVLVHLVRGFKQAGLRPSGMKSCESIACPHPSGARNQAGGTSSVRYEVARKESLSPFVRCANQVGGTSFI